MKIGSVELFFVQCIIYTILWLTNDYIATLLSIILFFLFFSVFIVAFIAEKLDKSNVPKNYFKLMISGFLAPLVIYIIFFVMNGGKFDWMKN